MARRAVTSPLDFFLISIWLRRKMALGSTLDRGMSLRDWYVSKCFPSSLAIPDAMSVLGSVREALRMDISAR